ncbi:hypothetical protein M378DRAFT_669616 [Amanita muscaria Koide BX008]|uniref:Crinkler effector protein N-terminal domain-containing protein n=1 Tax=Amanita muscaria (strain Koide BX008) TaxID=946122 RepID=A0A0C2X2L1_AMAMK|nr:hypothetical protein M378DRAFT_669616 [Amanita muscaria Koide BX008]
MPETPVSRRLWCLIEGESSHDIFSVTVGRDCEVSDLKIAIKSKLPNTLKGIGPHTLELWKPNNSIPLTDALDERIRSLGDNLSQFSNELDPSDNIFSIFPKQPGNDLEHLHIIVKVPAWARVDETLDAYKPGLTQVASRTLSPANEPLQWYINLSR